MVPTPRSPFAPNPRVGKWNDATESTAAAELSAYFESVDFGHASALAALALERLSTGDHASLKPEDDEPRFIVTDNGRRALRVAEVFDTNG